MNKNNLPGNQIRNQFRVLPKHLAIIPDGNRRWARERGLPSFEGHRRGFEAGVRLARHARKLGIHTLTFWAFSTENWKRAKKEVGYLMGLYERMMDKFWEEAEKDDVRVVHLGRKERLPQNLRKKIEEIERKTRGNKKHILNIALDYGGRDEILRAAQNLINKQTRQKLGFASHLGGQAISNEDFERYLDTAGQRYPEVDLIIRTSGEQRTSGFLIWQAAYAEYVFIKKHFPEMTEKDLEMAIREYGRRKRRWGGD